MNYWLIKFAPFRYSWTDCLRNGKFEIYSVKSPQSRNNLAKMKLEDKVLLYHSQQDLAVMGIMKVIAEAHQDPTTLDNKWLSVTFEPLETLNKPVELLIIKQTKGLENIGLIKQPRVAVMPITKKEFDIILNLGN
jgi:predicted RNA-binding protein with PUA-like domain